MHPTGNSGPIPGRPGPVAGWYPDPSGAPLQRYWDGVSWTQQTVARAGTAPVEAARKRAWVPWAIAGVCALLVFLLLVAWTMRPSREGRPGQPGQGSNRTAAMVYQPAAPR